MPKEFERMGYKTVRFILSEASVAGCDGIRLLAAALKCGAEKRGGARRALLRLVLKCMRRVYRHKDLILLETNCDGQTDSV